MYKDVEKEKVELAMGQFSELARSLVKDFKLSPFEVVAISSQFAGSLAGFLHSEGSTKDSVRDMAVMNLNNGYNYGMIVSAEVSGQVGNA